jgi:RHS repeat-associated protein
MEKVTLHLGALEVQGDDFIVYPHPNVRAVNGVPSYIATDVRGSTRLIIDEIGDPAEGTTYMPFGDPNVTPMGLPSNDVVEGKRFLGERYDPDAELSYLNARYYDPKLGMFIQPDWFEVTEQGVGTNRYSYSANDPVNLMDPGGNLFGPGEFFGPGGAVDNFIDHVADSFSGDRERSERAAEYNRQMRSEGGFRGSYSDFNGASYAYSEGFGFGPAGRWIDAGLKACGRSKACGKLLGGFERFGNKASNGLKRGGRAVQNGYWRGYAGLNKAVGHSTPWAKMTPKQKAKFQHSYSRHAHQFGLPNWSARNAEKLRQQFNAAVGAVRNGGTYDGVVRRTVDGVGTNVHHYSRKIGGNKYYYYETLRGQFVSSWLKK